MKNQNNQYKKIFKGGLKLKIASAGVVLEGFLSGLNFIVLLNILNLIFKGNITFSDIMRSVIFIAVIFVARLFLYSVSYTQSQIGGASVTKRLRIALGDKLRHIPLETFTSNRTGFYINAATSETADFEQILTHKVADIVKFTVLIFLIALYMCFVNVCVGLIVFATLILLVPAMALSSRQINHYGKAKNKAREENVSAITEYLSGSQTLRSYNLTGTKNKSLTASMKNYSDISYRYERAILPIGFAYVFLAFIGIASSLLIMADALRNGTITEPQMIIVFMMLLYVSKVEMSLYINLVSYRNLLISKNKISSIFDEKEEELHELAFEPKNFDIVFTDVDFAYAKEEPVLQKATFTIPQNKLSAIVGDSGSGKSTVFNLISKYYEADGGIITIGGLDIKDFSCEEVLKKISIVDQNVFLFNDTVLNNIRYAKEDATKEQVEEACRLANCHEFICSMADGYDTMIAENGNNLSGGERQRLSIARAILRGSPIVLLDEVTASLDIENELLVKRAIANLLQKNWTVVMIAHTMPIIENADNIIVVDSGKVCESGTHEQLMALNGKYAKMQEASKML